MVCLDSDIVKVKAGQSKVMSMLRIIDGCFKVSGVTKIEIETEDRLKESKCLVRVARLKILIEIGGTNANSIGLLH